ncbi:hypothetical protein TrLO_g8005 [Triparma laevis f. longispina]|uniref:Uncharacterized protein n=1 Tax=Triparma laevis f. longispina TaxID=1714387 RepID=A0A9W6ZZW0_9STRA|nr:hypothetical protein TrLO_g8005 [Triparma laevis f. longispina]
MSKSIATEFMYTPEFRKNFVDFVQVDALMALRLAKKGWNAAADALIDEGVRSRELIVHGGNNISKDVVAAREERRKLATRVVFLLNITKIGRDECYHAANLVVVDIPEGIVIIGDAVVAYLRSQQH